MGNVERLYYGESQQVLRETAGSNAFKIEYLPDHSDAEIREDIISYLGEYRFNLKKYDYELQFCTSPAGRHELQDVHRGESMMAKAKRAIEIRKVRGEPTQREEAELSGIKNLEDSLRFAKSGSTVIWASPPGAKEEGYGDYGFIFMGKIDKSSPSKTRLLMTAIRLEKPSINDFNRSLTLLTEEEFNFTTAEEFIQNPFIFGEPIEKDYLENVLEKCFLFEANDNEKIVFKNVISKLDPTIDEFVRFIRYGKREEKVKAFNSIENYALELKKRYKQSGNIRYLDERERHEVRNLSGLISRYGFEPPVVRGSCGSTKNMKSNNILNNGFEALRRSLPGEEDEWFTCPKCSYKADGPVGNKCPGCGLTKEDYSKESGGASCG